jgi:hypothetical protein
MEWGDEEAAQESTRRGPPQIRWCGPERGQKAGQSRKRAQGGPGQKPQEKNRRAAQPDAQDRDAETNDSSGSRRDSLPLRKRRDWSGLWRNPLFRSAPLVSVCAIGPIEGSGQAVQLSFLCACGSRIELKNLGCCRSCYDRRHHSLRFFGGLRERVLMRDRFRCRVCGKRSALVVHHRDRRNRTNFLVTLCVRCHVRIHRSSGLRYSFSKVLVRLWRELHPNAPMQLQLSFQNVGKKNYSGAVRNGGEREWGDNQRNIAVTLMDLWWRTKSPMG